MFKKIFKRLLIALLACLNQLAYEKLTLDKLNKKLIEPVPGLLVNGKQLYKFVNSSDMPEGRFVHFMALRQELAMGIDRPLLNEYLDKLLQANNKADASRIGQLLFMLKDTANNCTPIESLYHLAALVYFDREEDLSTFDADYNLQKVEGFKQLKDQSFFLNTLSRHLMPLGVQLPSDIDSFLKTSLAKLKAYQRILSGTEGSKTS